MCRTWLAFADPDGAYEKWLTQRERRHLALGADLDGNLHVRGQLDPIEGEGVARLIERRARELFDEDWAAANAAHPGEVPDPKRLRRTSQQRT